MKREKEPKTIRVEHPGEGFWEMVEGPDGKITYAVFHPPTKERLLIEEKFRQAGKRPPPRVSYTETMLGPQNEDFIVTYIPLQRCPWMLPGPPEPYPAHKLW